MTYYELLIRALAREFEWIATFNAPLMEGMSEEALDSLEDDMYGSGRDAV